MNGLTVVIPSRDKSNLIECMGALNAKQSHIQIIQVDDSENRELLNIDWPFYCGINIAGRKPFNFAYNCNLGINTAAPDDVILLNDDALLETPSGFTAMQREAEAHPEFGIIGATTNLTGQPLQWTADRHPGVSPGLREVPWFAFICVLIPRRTIERVGLLDERYCLDYGAEDRDYCQMVRAAGLKCGVYDYCFVDHSKLTSTYRGSPTGQRSSAKNKALYHEKWPGAEF
jgi:hypothetical protein